MKRKYLAFDLETAKVLPEATSDLFSHRPLGICCAAAVTEDGAKPRVWYGRSKLGEPAESMSHEEVKRMVHELVELVNDDFTLLTWNGLNFDFNVMAEESGLVEECSSLALGHVDIMFHAVCVLGHPVSLDKAAQGMGIEGKLTGIEGSKVPLLWAEGRHAEVLDYNTQDAKATLELARLCEDGGAMKWVTRRGTLSRMPLSQGWLAVRDARLLPEPDTSWMTQPPRREDFFRWFPTTGSA